METENVLGTAPVRSLIAKFSIPAVVAAVVNSLYNMVDQIFIGNGVGYLGNGATNVIFPMTILALAIGQMAGDGCASYMNLKLGMNQREKAEKSVSTTAAFLILAGIVIAVLFALLLEPMCRLFGSTDAILPYALEYGRVIIIGLPFFIVSVGLNSIIRADGRPMVSMTSMVAGCVFNIICDPLLIFVFHMGVTGAAIATVGGQIITCGICVYYATRLKHVHCSLKPKNWSLHGLLRALQLGISSFVVQIAIVLSMFVANNMLVKFGAESKYGADIPLTVMGIVMKVNQVLMGILLGIGTGSQPVISFNYGAKKNERVRETFWTAAIVSMLIAAVAFLLFEFAPGAIIGLFGSEGELYNEFAEQCFRIFLMLCVCNAFHAISCVFFQAVGKPRQAAILSLLRQVIIVLPAMVLLPRFMGVIGVLWAGPLADGISCILAVILVMAEMKKLKQYVDCSGSAGDIRLKENAP